MAFKIEKITNGGKGPQHGNGKMRQIGGVEQHDSGSGGMTSDHGFSGPSSKPMANSGKGKNSVGTGKMKPIGSGKTVTGM